MAKKIPINKLDIARWIAVFPLTVIAILLYIKIILDPLYRLLPLVFDIKVTNFILNIFNALLIPITITACVYWISPKNKRGIDNFALKKASNWNKQQPISFAIFKPVTPVHYFKSPLTD